MQKIDWKYNGPAVSDKDIRAVEAVLSVQLPADYIDCIREHNGARPRPNAVDIAGRKGTVFEHLLRVDLEAKGNVLRTWEAIRSRAKNGLIPFAGDPFGNLFCFDFSSGSSGFVVFWEHEHGSLTVVASSFTELIGMLHKPKS